MKQLGQYAAPRHAIAHLSDPHLIGGGGLHYGVIDNVANLRRALDRLAAVRPAPQALVLTGDDGFQDRVHEVDGLRIVALDTSVPGYHHGALRPEQLAWLADVLATPAQHGTLLAMHHPPLPPPMLRAAELIELHDQQLLADVIAGTDVRGILAGHLHFSTWSTFAGVPVSVASASCYTTDPAPADRFVSSVDAGQAFTMVHTYDDRLVHTLVPLERGTEVSHIGLDIAEALETVSLEEARELASSKTSPFNN